MIDYKLIEQRLEDALSKETKESLLEWLKNHETQNQEDQRSVNVDQRVMPEIAELKKMLNEVFEMLLEAPELNMGNYDENQVRELNYAVISTFNYLKKKREQFSA